MTAAPRILFVDDTAERHASALRELQREFPNLQVTEACDAGAFSDALDAGDFDLAIAGDPLPWTSALDVLRALKARWPGRPVILSAARVSDGTLVEAIREGLDDYVIRLEEYERRLGIAVHAALEVSNRDLQRRGIVEALRQSEERFSRFLQTNPVGVTITTIDEGRFLDVNDRYLELTGYSREEIVGRTVLDLGIWADPRDRARVVGGLRAKGVVRDFEARYRTKSGEIRESLASFEIINFEGRPAILALTNDITDRKRVEQALRDSEEQYRLLFDRNPLPLWIFDTVTLRFLAVNEAAMAHYGYSRPEFLSMTIKDLRRPEDLPALLDYLAQLERQGGRPLFASIQAWRHRKKDGSMIDVEVTRSAIDFQGRNACLVLVKDITERKRMEEALRESEEKYRSLVANIPDVIWTCDSEGRVTFISANVESQTGFSPEEIHRGGEAHWSERAHPDDLGCVWRRYRALFETGEPYDVEYRMRRPDGSWLWLHERALKTYQRDGVWYADGISSDVTERKEAEERLKRSERQLQEAQQVGHVGSWEWDLVTGTLSWSHELYRIYGLDPLRFTPTYEAFLERVCVEDRDRVRSTIEKALRDRRPFSYDCHIRRPDGSLRVKQSRGEVVLDVAGRPVRMIGIAQDITERRQAEEERARLLESERTARAGAETVLSRLQSIQRVTDATLAHLTLDDLLREMVARIQATLAADTVVVYLLSRDRTWLSVRASEGVPKRAAAGCRIPVGQDFAGVIAARREPKRVSDLPGAGSRKSPLHRNVRSLVGVPLVVEGNVIGVLEAGSRKPRRFTMGDLQLLQLVADRVAPSIDRARLFEEVRQGREQLRALSRSLVEMQETERRLIARELHDEVGQLLTGLKLAMENGGRFRRDLAGQKETKAIVNDLIGRVRNLSMNLRPAMLDDLGLVPALLWHVERYTTQTGVRVEFHHAGAQRRLPSEIETAAFRIVQEALTNVARHAGVKKVKVDVRVSTDRLSVRIKDQGAGFEPEIVMAGDSSGLAGMRERVNLLQGWLTIESAPGSGTHLTAELPLAAEAAGKGANVRNHNHRARRRPPGRAAGPAGVAGI
jgi:PAS domain S-box-containing protein